MQLINHDMDDLFRKAAEHYPLHTNTGNWDKVMQKMEQGQKDGQRNNRGRSRWLLLLLPLLFICNRFVYVNRDASLPAEVRPEKWRNGKEVEPLSRGHLNGVTGHTITGSKQGPVEKGRKGPGIEMNASLDGNRFIEKDGGEKNTSSIINRRGSVLKGMDNLPGIIDQTTPLTGDKHTDVSSSIAEARKSETATKAETETKEDQKLSETLPGVVADTGAKTTEMGKKNRTRFAKSVYVGIMGGPDRSSVRSSKTKGVGYSAGLLAGYRFSKRMAVETGVYWDRKKYATDGKGFSTAQFNWLPHTNLLSIEGYCDMIEIPLVVRYNVVSTASKGVFATAGASSYIMKKEDYQYDTERYGVYYSGKKTYMGSDTHFMPVLHFSAGYEQSLGRSVKLRLEPYMKVPVAGIGVGNMSLKSTGILVGITRSIR